MNFQYPLLAFPTDSAQFLWSWELINSFIGLLFRPKMQCWTSIVGCHLFYSEQSVCIPIPIWRWQWDIRLLCIWFIAFRHDSWGLVDHKFFGSHCLRVSYHEFFMPKIVVMFLCLLVWSWKSLIASDVGSWNRCSSSQTGDLTKSDRAVDGIFGFGQQEMSVISQLSSQGAAPNVFSHCLRGDDVGGGILVFGEIVEPNIVYTPLVPSQ